MSDKKQADDGLERARAMWGAGDHEGLIRMLHTTMAEDFVAGLGTSPPGCALDIGCGIGTSALPLARSGYKVTGLDLSPGALDVARRNASDEGLNVQFDEGVAEHLPYEDARFDIAVSMFGIAFSQAPRAAISEVARVLKPGGWLALANWTRDGFTGRMGGVMAPYLPPSSGGNASPGWGDSDKVRSLLDGYFEDITTAVTTTTWTVQLDPAGAARQFLEKAGPMQMLLKGFDADTRQAFTSDFERFWAENNISTDPWVTIVQNEYLNASATRRFDTH